MNPISIVKCVATRILPLVGIVKFVSGCINEPGTPEEICTEDNLRPEDEQACIDFYTDQCKETVEEFGIFPACGLSIHPDVVVEGSTNTGISYTGPARQNIGFLIQGDFCSISCFWQARAEDAVKNTQCQTTFMTRDGEVVMLRPATPDECQVTLPSH